MILGQTSLPQKHRQMQKAAEYWNSIPDLTSALLNWGGWGIPRESPVSQPYILGPQAGRTTEAPELLGPLERRGLGTGLTRSSLMTGTRCSVDQVSHTMVLAVPGSYCLLRPRPALRTGSCAFLSAMPMAYPPSSIALRPWPSNSLSIGFLAYKVAWIIIVLTSEREALSRTEKMAQQVKAFAPNLKTWVQSPGFHGRENLLQKVSLWHPFTHSGTNRIRDRERKCWHCPGTQEAREAEDKEVAKSPTSSLHQSQRRSKPQSLSGLLFVCLIVFSRVVQTIHLLGTGAMLGAHGISETYENILISSKIQKKWPLKVEKMYFFSHQKQMKCLAPLEVCY